MYVTLMCSVTAQELWSTYAKRTCPSPFVNWITPSSALTRERRPTFASSRTALAAPATDAPAPGAAAATRAARAPTRRGPARSRQATPPAARAPALAPSLAPAPAPAPSRHSVPHCWRGDCNVSHDILSVLPGEFSCRPLSVLSSDTPPPSPPLVTSSFLSLFLVLFIFIVFGTDASGHPLTLSLIS